MFNLKFNIFGQTYIKLTQNGIGTSIHIRVQKGPFHFNACMESVF